MQLVADLILVGVLVAAAVTDLRSGRIYNWLVYPAILVGLALGGLEGGWDGLMDHGLGAGVGFAFMFVCFALGGLGGGDVKLMAAVGALGGWERAVGGPFVLYALAYSFAIGMALAVIAVIWRRTVGLAVARMWWGLRVLASRTGNLKDAVPDGGTRIPFGFATAVGTLWVLAENHAGVTLGTLLKRLLTS